MSLVNLWPINASPLKTVHDSSTDLQKTQNAFSITNSLKEERMMFGHCGNDDLDLAITNPNLLSFSDSNQSKNQTFSNSQLEGNTLHDLTRRNSCR